MDKDLPDVSELVGTPIKGSGSSKFSNLMALRSKRENSTQKHPIEEVVIFESETDLTQLPVHENEYPVCALTPDTNSNNTYNSYNGLSNPLNFVQSDEELSDLENFKPINQLLAQGGDVSHRAQFIMNQFGKTSPSTNNSESVKTATPRGRRATKASTGVPGLDPSVTQTRKRLGASRYYKKS